MICLLYLVPTMCIGTFAEIVYYVQYAVIISNINVGKQAQYGITAMRPRVSASSKATNRVNYTK